MSIDTLIQEDLVNFRRNVLIDVLKNNIRIFF